MNIWLDLGKFYVPGFLKRRVLVNLTEITAESFSEDTPSLEGMSYEDMLKSYADFSKSVAEKALKNSTDREEIKDRLYEKAYGWGARLRKSLGIDGIDQFMRAEKIIYGILGIEFTGERDGEIRIERCYFSNYYSPEICGLISALDTVDQVGETRYPCS